MLVLYAAVMPVVLLFCGIALDVGILELTKLRMQTAADAGALAAQLEAERGTGNWQTMAMEDASINGFTNGQNNVTITVSQFPAYGDYQGRYDALQVTITQNLSTVFMWTLNGGTVSVSASSVALLTPCAYFYGGGSGALTAYGVNVYTGSLLGNTCPLYASYGIDIEAPGQLATEAQDISGPASQSVLDGVVSFPSPMFNTVAIPDPLAWETQPTLSGACTYTGLTVSNTTRTLSPGNYCKGLNLTNSTVTLSPGLYVITGGATWSNSTVTGTGVTLFFTNGGGTTSYGQFVVKYGSMTLSAPTDSTNGGIPGVLVFADRNWVHTGAQDFQLYQLTNYYGDGIWYIKGAGMSIAGCKTGCGTVVTAPDYFGIVADNLYVTATIVHLLNNYSSLPAGNPFLPSGLPIGGLVQ